MHIFTLLDNSRIQRTINLYVILHRLFIDYVKLSLMCLGVISLCLSRGYGKNSSWSWTDGLNPIGTFKLLISNPPYVINLPVGHVLIIIMGLISNLRHSRTPVGHVLIIVMGLISNLRHLTRAGHFLKDPGERSRLELITFIGTRTTRLLLWHPLKLLGTLYKTKITPTIWQKRKIHGGAVRHRIIIFYSQK